MPTRTARDLVSRYWDGHLPVDPVVIAQALDVKVEADPDLGSAYGRFEMVDGQPHIYFNPDEPRLRQRLTIAHELGYYAMKHGNRFVDTVREFRVVQLDFVKNEANIFALELLMPGYAVDIMIQKRKIMTLDGLSDAFHVYSVAMNEKLKRMGWMK